MTGERIDDLETDDALDAELDALDPDDAEPLTAVQPSSPAGRRLLSSRDNWRMRAKASEAERDAMQKRVAELEAQTRSADQLRTSILHNAIRGAAAGRVRPEILDDVVRLVDLHDIQVAGDGSIDHAKLTAKIEEFVKARPVYAAAAHQNGRPHPLPGGHRPASNRQLTPNTDINDALRRMAGGSN